jgi:hypothetical protein
VLLDAEAKVAGLREVALPELVLLNLEATLEDLLRLGATDGDVARNLLVTADAERADGVARLGGDGRLAGELLQDLGRTGEAVTRLSDGDVCSTGRTAGGRRRVAAGDGPGPGRRGVGGRERRGRTRRLASQRRS